VFLSSGPSATKHTPNRIVTELIMHDLEEGVCHQMFIDGKEANPLEAIRVVSRFLDVFL
jgi:hypothetical protein